MEKEAFKFSAKIGNWLSAIILGNTRELIARIDERTNQMYDDLKDNIKPDLKNVREKFAALEGKTAQLFAATSPIALKAKGIKILEKSGLKAFIDGNKQSLLDQFKLKCVIKNQYDIQEQSFKFFDEYDFKDLEVSLKQASYDFGVDIDTIRRIGGIYFRDIALLEAGFKPEDLDKPKS